MKVMKIKIKSQKEFEEGLRSVAHKIDSGKTLKRRRGGVFFESMAAVRTILTDKRLELWRTIRDQKPESISALALLVKRNLRAVHRDVMLLKELGLITLKKAKGSRGDTQSPVALADTLILSVA